MIVLTRFSASDGRDLEPSGKGNLSWGSDSPVRLLLSTLRSAAENKRRSAGVLSPVRCDTFRMDADTLMGKDLPEGLHRP